MNETNHYDVIIIGGSYSGLSAGLALGRAVRKALIIDSGKACNRKATYSHNFLTQDGKTPKVISALAKRQVEMYDTVTFLNSHVSFGEKAKNGFEIGTANGDVFTAKRLIFATGIKDTMPSIDGFAECWGVSVLHCPYCHGYEIRNEPVAILGNGQFGYEFSKLILNWTKDITLLTNGSSTLTDTQTDKLNAHQIKIKEKEVDKFEHTNGYIQCVLFKDMTRKSFRAIYTRVPFEQHCHIPKALGCEITKDGYILTDDSYQTTVKGIYACGDNVSRTRSVAYAVSQGMLAGMALNKDLLDERFEN